MLTCDLIRVENLTPRDQTIWQDMIDATEAFQSPVLSPAFIHAVAAVRDDIVIAVYRRDGETIGFLPHHRRPNRFARPVGAPFADYSALITFPDTDLKARDALAAARIDRYQAIGLIDPYGVFGEVEGTDDMGYGIDLGSDKPLNTVTKKHSKNINRHRRNLIAAHGEITFRLSEFDREHYEMMLRLKREQLEQNGLHNFLDAPWAANLLEQLFDAPRDGLHGALLVMMVGDAPVMFHYGLRYGDRMHPWVSSFDPAFGEFSPGQIFLCDAPAVLRDAGIRYYDLSTGQTHYKSSFCNTQFPVTHARIYGGSASAHLSERLAHLASDVQKSMDRNRIGRGMANALTRLNRRVDQIACLELDFASRAKGVAHAFANARRRIGGAHAG